MDVTTIQQAVTTLQQQGKPVSVRNVHRLTGGSFRDISRILRALQMSPPKPIPAQQFQHIAAVTQEPHASQQAPTATPHVTTPRLSLEAQEALAEYHNVRATISAYEAMSERDWKRSPVSPGTILTPLWQKLEEAKRRCLLLGVDPQCDRR